MSQCGRGHPRSPARRGVGEAGGGSGGRRGALRGGVAARSAVRLACL